MNEPQTSNAFKIAWLIITAVAFPLCSSSAIAQNSTDKAIQPRSINAIRNNESNKRAILHGHISSAIDTRNQARTANSQTTSSQTAPAKSKAVREVHVANNQSTQFNGLQKVPYYLQSTTPPFETKQGPDGHNKNLIPNKQGIQLSF